MRLSSLFLLPAAAGLAAAAAVDTAAESCQIYDFKGTCLPTADCGDGKVSTPSFCPNQPKDIQCCTKKPSPEIPESNCKPHVIKAGETILKEQAGKIFVVWCYADKSGEHGKGLALDLMVGAYNPNGQVIAEWVMNHHKELNVMYIIWGQKIWNPSNGEEPTPWENWRDMEDRGDPTNNHWDHNHISFNPA